MIAAGTEVRIQGKVTARATGAGKYQQAMTAAGHGLMADEPVALGGLDCGPSPYDFLSAGLAACTSMTIVLYAERRQLSLPGFTVEVGHDRIHAADCDSCLAGATGRIDRFMLQIVFDDEVAADLQAKILEIAAKCPVHLTLQATSAIVTSVAFL